MKKTISILGSTGSIGLTTLKIINKRKNFLKHYLFSSNKNYTLICKQIKYYKPQYFLVADYLTYQKLKKNIKKVELKF